MTETTEDHPSAKPGPAGPRLAFPDRTTQEGFANDLAALRRESMESLCHGDFLHLLKMERIGHLCTLLGYATAWFIPNPVSAFLIAQGILTRWLLMHHISHGGYDQVPGVPSRYTSRHFAQGWRRFVDWFDWILPEAWACEHNLLHHYHTGEEMDPDLAERHAELLRNLRCPRSIKYVVLLLLGITWKITYYAPNTLNEMMAHKLGKQQDVPIAPVRPSNILDLRNTLVRQFWWSCFLPFFTFHFVLIPLLFLPLGPYAALFVLINRVLAEFITNFHSYLVISPNHSGEDLCRFDYHFRDKPEFYVNQVLGSVNYRTGNDWIDYPQMWLNYQIEHHLIPNLPMTHYQRIQPKVKALCEKHGLPYLQEGVFRRFKKFLDICVGSSTMILVDARSRQARSTTESQPG